MEEINEEEITARLAQLNYELKWYHGFGIAVAILCAVIVTLVFTIPQYRGVWTVLSVIALILGIVTTVKMFKTYHEINALESYLFMLATLRDIENDIEEER